MSSSNWSLLLNLAVMVGIPLFLIILGFSIGRVTEMRHLARLEEGEREHADILVTNTKKIDQPGAAGDAALLLAEVVISADYFKSFLARIRKIFGGELRSYRTIMMRTRREALLRLRQQARARGYTNVGNVRFESADITGSITSDRKRRKKIVVMRAILASGTAYGRMS